MNETVIETKDLTKRYDEVVAVNRDSLSVPRGEVLGFLGPNGAGKTTTMRMLTCFTAPTEGSAVIDGHDVIADAIGARRSIGYLPESNPLYPDLLAVEYLQFAAELRGIERGQANKRIKSIIEQTGLGDYYARPIRTLSKGFRQRVGLAQALVHQPPILILDEPMSGLDPNQAVEIRDLIRDIGRERTVILSTHNLAEVQVACDRVLIIANGKLVADDKPERLRERAGKPRYRLTILKDDDAVASKCEAALKALPGVAAVSARESEEANEAAFDVDPSGAEDLRAPLFKACVDGGFTLIGLAREGQNLERIFRELTTASSGNTTPPPQA
jgi:ABC-2 type transport system ATP-binding protein